MKIAAIIVAAGASTRFGGELPKQFKTVCGKPLLAWTIKRFENAATIANLVVVVAEEHLLYASERIIDEFDFKKVTRIVIGGAARRESVFNGLKSLPISTNFVAIHDGVRPLTSSADIDRTVEVAIKERAAILAAPVTDTIKRTTDKYIISTVDRSSLYQAQTPQVFQYDLIMEAHKTFNKMNEESGRSSNALTDDASMIEGRGFKVAVVEPTSVNLKVTTTQDMEILEAILKSETEGTDADRQRI